MVTSVQPILAIFRGCGSGVKESCPLVPDMLDFDVGVPQTQAVGIEDCLDQGLDTFRHSVYG